MDRLLYADDAGLLDTDAESASERLGSLSEGLRVLADMELSVPKTEAMFVRPAAAVTIEQDDFQNKTVLPHECDVCALACTCG